MAEEQLRRDTLIFHVCETKGCLARKKIARIPQNPPPSIRLEACHNTFGHCPCTFARHQSVLSGNGFVTDKPEECRSE